MPGWLFAVIVIVFLAVAILLVRRSMNGAVVERRTSRIATARNTITMTAKSQPGMFAGS